MRRYWKLLAVVPWFIAAAAYFVTVYVDSQEREDGSSFMKMPAVRREVEHTRSLGF